jgi:BirA family biotin operon repressor/biotin-[acetyl-CoA-carboxylase] ligase
MFEHLSDRSIIDAYRDRSMMLNRRISFTFNGVTLQGVAMDINDAGNLIVRCDSGDTITLVGGEVSFGSDNI